MTRAFLCNRRHSERLTFTHGGLGYTATVSHFSDGRPAEVFLDAGKPGSAIQHIARDLGVVTSIALQYGATANELAHALTRLDDGAPAGPLGELRCAKYRTDGHHFGSPASRRPSSK